jgi:Glycosyl transferases group 1
MLFVGVFSLMLISQMQQSTSSVWRSWSSDHDMHQIGSRPAAYGDALQQQQQRLTTSETVIATNPSPGFPGSDVDAGVVPTAWYQPQASMPLQVRFLGRHVLAPPLDPTIKRGSIRVDTNSTDDPLWDAMERSKYTRVVQTVMYDPSSRKIASRNLYNPNATVGSSSSASQPNSSAVTVTLLDWATLERDCHALRQMLAHASLLPVEGRRHVFVYWDSTNSPIPRTCDLDESVLSQYDSFHYVQRSVVQGRRWNQDARWIEPGQRWTPASFGPSDATTESRAAAVVDATARVSPASNNHLIRGWYHENHPLREVFVRQLVKTAAPITLESLPANSTRTTSVSFFLVKGNTLPYSFFRERVSSIIGMLAMERKFKYLVDEVEGSRKDPVAHEMVPSSYVRALLKSKIVVIASHDEWEGHWRLWESMASGALVLSEVMAAPPAGLENGTNVILYDSPDSLRRLVLYYLEHGDERRRIAQRGQELALGLHRSWHGLERVLFGQPLTGALEPYAQAPTKRRHG